MTVTHRREVANDTLMLPSFAADRLGVRRQTVYYWLKRGIVKSVKRNGRVLVSLEDVQRVANERAVNRYDSAEVTERAGEMPNEQEQMQIMSDLVDALVDQEHDGVFPPDDEHETVVLLARIAEHEAELRARRDAVLFRELEIEEEKQAIEREERELIAARDTVVAYTNLRQRLLNEGGASCEPA